MKYKKFIAASAIALMGLTGCTVTNPNPDENGILYDKGPIRDTEFSTCVAPGEKKFSSLMDESFTYPAGQRYFVFSNEGGDRPPYEAPTKDAVTVGVEGQMRFELTGDCELLQQFHEKIGLRNKGDEGWNTILTTYLSQPLNRAISEVTQTMDWQALYSEADAKAQWEKRVMEKLNIYINQAAGGDYFQNIALTLQKPILPEELTKALQAAQTAQQENIAQQSRNEQIDTEIMAIEKLVDILGPQAYVTYKAVQDGKITVMPIPAGSNVAIPGR